MAAPATPKTWPQGDEIPICTECGDDLCTFGMIVCMECLVMLVQDGCDGDEYRDLEYAGSDS